VRINIECGRVLTIEKLGGGAEAKVGGGSEKDDQARRWERSRSA
jgi:hypothetical protein